MIAGVIVLAALLYPGALVAGQSFFERDLHLDWYPRLAALARCLAQGAWPLWDPSIGFGQPLLADPGTETAYPLAWLALLVPLRFAYTVFVLEHLFVGALGVERLARRLGAGRVGAPAAAAIFVLSGPLQSSLNLWHHFAGACWMPWVVLAADRAVRRSTARSAAGLALAAGLQILAGSADLCAMTWLLAGGWFLLNIARARPSVRRLRAAGVVLGGALLAGGLAAVVWLPAADVLSRSARRDLPESVRTAFSVPVSGLLRVVAPLDPARVGFDPSEWERLYDRPEPPLLRSLYLGVPVLSLALLPLTSRVLRRRATALLAAAGVSLVVAMGSHGPAYGPLTSVVPPLRIFRYPSKATLPFALAVALAAGLGLGLVARRRLGGRRAWLAAGGISCGGLVVALASSSYLPTSSALFVAVPGLACAGLIVVGMRRRAPARLMAGAVAAACVVELVVVHARLNATAPTWVVFASPSVVTRIDRSEGRRLYVYDYHTLPGTAQRLLGRADPYRTAVAPPGVDPRVFATSALRLYLPPPSSGFFGLEGSYDLDIRGLYPHDLNDLTFYLRLVEGTPVLLKLLRMGAVGTVLSLHRAGLQGLRLEHELPSPFPEPILVWSVPGAMPRAWIVGCARVADRGDAFRVLASPDYDPAGEVILPRPAGVGGGCGPAGTARLTSRLPDRLTIAADASRSGYLVLADAWDPGWRVTLDGRSAPLLRANIAFRGVFLAPGRHLVEMVYRPLSAVIGAVLSILSLLAVLGLGLVARARGARGSQPH